MEEAIRAGYRHIDCAFIYGNEVEVGEALQKVFKEGIVKREELFITSKLWNEYHAAEDVPKTLQDSLKNLQLEYLDLYLVHWPRGIRKGATLSALKDDDVIDCSEERFKAMWTAMEEQVKKGFVRAIGISNFTITQTELLLKNATVIPAVNQVENHPYLQQEKLKKYCDSKGIVLEAYSPLGNPARPVQAGDDPRLMDDPVIVELAAKYSATPAQICIAFQLHRGRVSVIPKTVTKKRVHENLAATKLELTKEDMDKIYGISRKFRFLGTFMLRSNQTMADYWDEERLSLIHI